MPKREKRTNCYVNNQKSMGEIFNQVHKAFRSAFPELADEQITPCIRNIVLGLSSASTGQPACFRVGKKNLGKKVIANKERSAIEDDANEKRSAIEGDFIAAELSYIYEGIMKKPATVSTDPETKKPYGRYFDLVEAVFIALGIPDSPEHCAKRARERGGVWVSKYPPKRRKTKAKQ